jgi:hypothetical protein
MVFKKFWVMEGISEEIVYVWKSYAIGHMNNFGLKILCKGCKWKDCTVKK